MQIASTIRQTRYDVFHWRYHASLSWKITLAAGMAGLTGLLAQVRLPLAGTPVPVTGQTLAVLLAGVLLGRGWGGLSLAFYTALGLAGVPWFNGATSGLGATGGYLFGFILAALFVGHFTDRYVKARRFGSLLAMMLVANFVLIYIPGLVWLGTWLNLVAGKPASFVSVINMGAVPFIPGDILKAAAAAAIAWAVIPKSAYNTEAASVDGKTNCG